MPWLLAVLGLSAFLLLWGTFSYLVYDVSRLLNEWEYEREELRRLEVAYEVEGKMRGRKENTDDSL